jgi:hypothetical protein
MEVKNLIFANFTKHVKDIARTLPRAFGRIEVVRALRA